MSKVFRRRVKIKSFKTNHASSNLLFYSILEHFKFSIRSFFSRLHFGFFRRVHITQSTLENLRGEYQVEPGLGHTRNQYLRYSRNQQTMAFIDVLVLYYTGSPTRDETIETTVRKLFSLVSYLLGSLQL